MAKTKEASVALVFDVTVRKYKTRKNSKNYGKFYYEVTTPANVSWNSKKDFKKLYARPFTAKRGFKREFNADSKGQVYFNGKACSINWMK